MTGRRLDRIAALQSAIIAQVNLLGEQFSIRFGCRQRTAVNPLEDGVERFERARHALGEAVAEAITSRQGRALHTDTARELCIDRQGSFLDRDDGTRYSSDRRRPSHDQRRVRPAPNGCKRKRSSWSKRIPPIEAAPQRV